MRDAQDVRDRGRLVAGLAGLIGRSTAATSQPIVVRLPAHVFGQTQRADARAVSARWGKGPGRVGFEHAEYGPTGGSPFDVVQGVVCILDQHNGRALVFERGRAPHALPLRVAGSSGDRLRSVESDLAVGRDGIPYVLEPVASGGEPLLPSFPPGGGAQIAAVSMTGSHPIVRTAGATAYVTEGYLGLWTPLMRAGHDARRLPTSRGRPFADGSNVFASTSGTIASVILSRPDRTHTTWQISMGADRSLEDAEPVGRNAAVVLHVVRGNRAEYEVLLLGSRGLLRRFSTPADDYVEKAPYADFRIDGASLYRLGSNRAGVFVDRYDLAS